MKKEKIVGYASIAAAVLVTLAVLLATPFIKQFEGYGYSGAFFIAMLSSATIFIPAPGWAVIIAMGRVLDPLLLGIIAGVGSGIGELSSYLVGAGGKIILNNNNTKRYNEYMEKLEKNAPLTIFILAAIPNPIFDIAGMAAGAIRMPLWKFLAACILGKIIKCIVFAYLGNYSNLYF
jgi:uncharacterized membrane protein YdjX (TVP38/TMEM64 family)